MNFENPQQIIKQSIERERVYEQVFVAFILGKLIEEFEEDLYETIEDEDKIHKILDAINGFGADDQKKILSIPKSIRQLRFKALFKKASVNQNFDAKLFVQELFTDADSKGYTLGYHASPFKISPKDSDWTINPTGLDDRDDRPMAYYSLDYKNLFRKNRGKNIYLVRAETGASSTHKRDTSNNWGRANKLSVITSLSLEEVDKKITGLAEKEIKKAA